MLSYAGRSTHPALILIRNLQKSKSLGPKPLSASASWMKKRKCRAIGLALRKSIKKSKRKGKSKRIKDKGRQAAVDCVYVSK
jgi:hypothetical protein